MSIQKPRPPKPLAARVANRATESSGGWVLVLVVAVGFVAMIRLALGSGRA